MILVKKNGLIVKFAHRNIFATGGTGFVGQNLIKHLLELVDPSSIRLLSRGQHSLLETVQCDLLIQHIPEGVVDDIDTVFHLAGYAHDLEDSDTNKEWYHKVNVEATTRLAELSVKAGVKQFIFVSSVKALFCEGVYGQTKREAETNLWR